MSDYKQECINKSKIIHEKDVTIRNLNKKLEESHKDIKLYKQQRDEAEEALLPTKRSLEILTAEHGKLKRKLNRNN